MAILNSAGETKIIVPTTGVWGNLDMHPLGRDAVMITVRWIAHRPDQSVLWDFLDSYAVAIEDGHWKNPRRRCSRELALQLLDRAHLICQRVHHSLGGQR